MITPSAPREHRKRSEEFRDAFRRRKIAAKAARDVARTTPSTRAASARRPIDADGERMAGEVGAASPVGLLLLGGLHQHSTQCGRRRQNLRGFHYARTIMVKDRIGQVARARNRNCGGTRELDYLGGLLRSLLRISVRGLAPMSREVRRRLAPRLPRNLLLCGTRNLAPSRCGAVATAVDPLGGASRDQLSGESKGRSSDG